MALSDDLSRATWLLPWQPLEAADARERERLLARVLRPSHPLHASLEHGPTAIAARCDDVSDTLFLLHDPERLCVVPLHELGKASPSVVPSTFDTFEDFHEAYMLPDHLEHSDEDV